ncbi:hypothetical protein [Microbacterium sp. CJ88]|uniref:hypothetical protein n=1 Tax=Microbacterium sp. CJ88 TaxID=3445672 RepID=UPI003F65E967
MTEDRYRPVVAIEVDGLLRCRPWLDRPQSTDDQFVVELTLRRETYPTRFAEELAWNAGGEATVGWAFSRLGVAWVRGLQCKGIEVVWASVYGDSANTYFMAPLDLDNMTVVVRDDGQSYASGAEMKAYQLGRQFDGRPLLWVTDDLPATGRRLLDGLRRPVDRAVTATHYLPPGLPVSENDIDHQGAWLDLAQTPDGHDELRRRRRKRNDWDRRRPWGTERRYRAARPLQARLAGVLDPRSELAVALVEYALDAGSNLDLAEIDRIRNAYRMNTDPSAATLRSLLQIPPPASTKAWRTDDR